MSYLTKIQYLLPNSNQGFSRDFVNFLSDKGTESKNGIDLNIVDERYIPKTSFTFVFTAIPKVKFIFDDNSFIIVPLANVTNTFKLSPHKYSPIILDEFITRLSGYLIEGIDHTGFNLPFFDGIHPEILELRDILKDACLYHTFPKHINNAPWDFILPGTVEEIDGTVLVDYQKKRKPKVEIVSFDKCSTPIVQIDIQVGDKYEKFVHLFPEAIVVPDVKNCWVYIKNDYGIDICFVINETSTQDWSYHFAQDRLN